MAGVHMPIALGEALITTLVLVAILRARPELVDPTLAAPAPKATRLVAAFGLALTLGLLLFALPFASSWPDGLERVAAVLGFHAAVVGRAVPAPMADYRFPGLGSATAATSAAGFVGTLVAFAFAWVLAAFLARESAPDRSPGA